MGYIQITRWRHGNGALTSNSEERFPEEGLPIMVDTDFARARQNSANTHGSNLTVDVTEPLSEGAQP